jgi:hypothetical protein
MGGNGGTGTAGRERRDGNGATEPTAPGLPPWFCVLRHTAAVGCDYHPECRDRHVTAWVAFVASSCG